MIILGIVLLIIVVVAGAILALLGMAGHAVLGPPPSSYCVPRYG
jgi:hypothetical protein